MVGIQHTTEGHGILVSPDEGRRGFQLLRSGFFGHLEPVAESEHMAH